METVPQEHRVLVIRVRRHHEKWVTFSVIDHGVGIPEEVAAKLFTPFFTTRSEGMGLGLSLCRTVIEQHGGALAFEPLRPGQGSGTEFRFTLPAEGTGAAGRRARAEAPAVTPGVPQDEPPSNQATSP
jgi:two-component system sensor histidine kinase DctS